VADRTGLIVRVAHYPPRLTSKVQSDRTGCSRTGTVKLQGLFSRVSRWFAIWRGETTAAAGLQVFARPLSGLYEGNGQTRPRAPQTVRFGRYPACTLENYFVFPKLIWEVINSGSYDGPTRETCFGHKRSETNYALKA